MAQFEEERLDNWKQFNGTELGSLLGSIYGGQKPKINYPKVKRRAVTDSMPMFRPVCNKPSAVDPSQTTRRHVDLAVPKVYGRGASTDHLDDENVLPVQYITRRRSEGVIKKEMDDIKMKQSYYRPAYVQPFSSDAEKDKLSQIFTYKGGKALPGELIAPVSEAPFERAARLKGEERMNEFKLRRGLSVISANDKVVAPKALSINEQMQEQIAGEIQERMNYIENMKNLGSFSKAEETQIKAEIAQRVHEMKKLDKSI